MGIITKICIASLLCCFVFPALSVEPAFVVYYNSGGGNKIKNGKSNILKKGDVLLETETVKVPASGHLVLVCKNFNPVQLKTKGVYKIKNLLKQCQSPSSSVSSAYFKYIWEQFSHPHHAPEKAPREYMKTSGAVSRGNFTVNFNFNVDTIHYCKGKLNINWLPYSVYTFKIFDQKRDGRLLIETGVSSLNIDSISKSIKGQNEYYWQLCSVENSQTPRYYLKIWDEKTYEKAVVTIVKNAIPSKPAEKAYLTGFILEESHFLAEAAKFYKKAAELEPQNKIYEEAFNKFYE